MPFPQKLDVSTPPSYCKFRREGIFAFPLREDLDMFGVKFASKMIIIQVQPEDILVQNKANGAVRLHKATSIREADVSEYKMIRSAALLQPWSALGYARFVDLIPDTETRNAVLSDPGYAYEYAYYVDKKPSDITRAAALKSAKTAYFYALDVDRCPRDDTRNAAIGDPQAAFEYAKYVDQCPREDTRKAAELSGVYMCDYISMFGKKGTPWTRVEEKVTSDVVKESDEIIALRAEHHELKEAFLLLAQQSWMVGVNPVEIAARIRDVISGYNIRSVGLESALRILYTWCEIAWSSTGKRLGEDDDILYEMAISGARHMLNIQRENGSDLELDCEPE